MTTEGEVLTSAVKDNSFAVGVNRLQKLFNITMDGIARQENGHTGGSVTETSADFETRFPASIVPLAGEDALFGIMSAYRRDGNLKKVDLGIGAYRDENGKPWVLPVVRKSEGRLFNDPTINHEYLPITGLAEFTTAARQLILGEGSRAIHEERAISIQSISGTGAIHLGALFLSKFYRTTRGALPAVYIPSPTWVNHKQIFGNVGFTLCDYDYFDADTCGLAFDKMKLSLENAADGSIVVLHACAHNPTGVDPTEQQWCELSELIARKRFFPFFDCAYQGFASGDLDRDAWAIRYFVEQGHELIIAQSFSKNMGLYCERVGCFHFVAAEKNGQDTCKRLRSQLSILQRSEISNPPAYGVRIASLIMNDPALKAEWKENLIQMSGRISAMRLALRDSLEKRGTRGMGGRTGPGAWAHITNQIGMFSFTGLKPECVDALRSKWHIYMTRNGRISVAGLNGENVEYVAEAIDDVCKSA